MQKITLLAAGVILLGLTSCKKDRTCNCTETDTSGNNVNTITVTATFTKISKKEAKDACANYAKTETSDGSTTVTKTDCKLN